MGPPSTSRCGTTMSSEIQSTKRAILLVSKYVQKGKCLSYPMRLQSVMESTQGIEMQSDFSTFLQLETTRRCGFPMRRVQSTVSLAAQLGCPLTSLPLAGVQRCDSTASPGEGPRPSGAWITDARGQRNRPCTHRQVTTCWVYTCSNVPGVCTLVLAKTAVAAARRMCPSATAQQ